MLEKKHFHFIGISGIGMSGIAKILKLQGHTVSGCDKNIDNKHTKELLSLQCLIAETHQSNLCKDDSITTVVYSTVIPLDHPELIAAKKKGIVVIHRADVLAEIMKDKESIAISGSHGKTSTTALVAHILEEALDPTVIVGGHLNSTNSNAFFGSSDYVVAEADESDRSLLKLPKVYSIVTNVDLEHFETYQDFNDIKHTFTQFINTTTTGNSIICLDDPGIQSIIPNITKPYTTYGQSTQADIQIQNLQLEKDQSTFTLFEKKNNKSIGNIILPTPGLHYVLNATAAITLSLELSVPFDHIQKRLLSFTGVDRRFTYKGLSRKYKTHIFDDYGHHPKEIEHVLKIARNKTNKKLIVAFQPHRYSRTKHLWNDFVSVFAQNSIDTLIIADIFASSEKPIDNITSKHLVEAIKLKNPAIHVIYSPIDQEMQQIQNNITNVIAQDDLLLLLGAGKIHKIADKIL